mmetsp:Transcript_25412/g.73287  ORF Transcript_25412/g.73287 Transcript_25412/m.73287 type:complete len:604 (+) Transcript_25412:726-2537(+)
MLKAETIRHRHPAIKLARHPLVVKVVALQLQQQVPWHGREARALRGRGAAERDALLRRRKAREQRRQRNDRLRLSLALSLGLLGLLLALGLRPESKHLGKVLSVLQLHLQAQHVLPQAAILHAALSRALLQPLFKRKLENAAECRTGLKPGAQGSALRPRQLLEYVLQELARVLLAPGRKLGMLLADERPEHLRRHEQLRVILVVALLPRRRVPVAEHPAHELRNLRDEVAGRLVRRLPANAQVSVQVAAAHLGQREQQLDRRVHVAGVPQVLEADQAGTAQPLQGLVARLTDAAPVVVHVQINLHLCERLVGLLHLHRVNAPVLEMPRQVGVLDHVVLVGGVGVDVGALRRDRPELHDEREEVAPLLLLVEVVQRPVAAAGAVPEAPATADVAVRQIQPEVLRVPALLALPVLGVRADLPRGRQLHQVLEVLRLAELVVRLPAVRGLHGRRPLVRHDRVARAGDDHGKVRAGQRHGRLDPCHVHGKQRVLLGNVPLVLQEATGHANSQLRGLVCSACGRLLGHSLKLLDEVEAPRTAPLHVEIHHVGRKAHPRLEVHTEAGLAEGRVKREDTLVLVDLVVVLGDLDAVHERAHLFDSSLHGW